MKKIIFLTLLCAGSMSAHAVPMLFTATTAPNSQGLVSDWSILFNDNNGNGIMNQGERIGSSFSGMTVTNPGGCCSGTYLRLVRVADTALSSGPGGGLWRFRPGAGTGTQNPLDLLRGRWTYSITAVPEPGTLALLGLGLLGLAVRRRT